jgi:hypothetical protein
MYQTVATAAAAMAPLTVGIALQTPTMLDLTWPSIAGMLRGLFSIWQCTLARDGFLWEPHFPF